MEKKSFKVTVDGQTFDVIVEEVTEDKREYIREEDSNKQEVNQRGKKTQEVTSTGTEKLDTPETQVRTTETQERKEGTAEEKQGTAGEGTKVNAPMPGSIVEVSAINGQQVKEGDLLLILEAMKMENEITSPVSGTVAEIKVKKGDTVNSGDVLVVIS